MTSPTFNAAAGTVYFIGAGPGAPDLITVRGRAIIAQADLILYADSLVQEITAALARKPGARVEGSADLNLGQMLSLMTEAAHKGQVVARVHSGDPALYGAMREQMAGLRAAGVPYAVVPGVSATFAAAAELATELTVPGLTQTLIFTRTEGRTTMPPAEHLRLLAAHGSTLSIHMSINRTGAVVEQLLESGAYSPQTPAAVVYKATWPDQQIVRGTLATIARQVREAGFTRHALILVGESLDLERQAGSSNLYDAAYTHSFRRGDGPIRQAPRAESPRGGIAVLAVTKAGSALAAELAHKLSGQALIPAKFWQAGEARPYDGSVLAEVRRCWADYASLVLVMPAGVAVRAVGPLAADKATDPAVLCLDEAGRHVIALLGGHQAGANALAERVAALTGGQAIITTASDVQGLPALDLLGQAEGWKIAAGSALARAAAALINGEPVGVFIEPDYVKLRVRLAEMFAPAHNVHFVDQPEQAAGCTAGLIITHRRTAPAENTVVYHPPVLWVGLGMGKKFERDDTLREAIDDTLAINGLAPDALAGLATIDIRAQNQAMRHLIQQWSLPLIAVTADEIRGLEGKADFTTSVAQQKLGLPGVAEPSALLASQGGRIIVPKRAYKRRCTVAVALQGGL